MPVMCGTEAIRLITNRAEEGIHPKPKIIVVTAHAMDEYGEKAFGAGADYFLAKPCSIQSVEECLTKVLSIL